MNKLIIVLKTIEEFLYKKKASNRRKEEFMWIYNVFLIDNRNLCSCISQYGIHMNLWTYMLTR